MSSYFEGALKRYMDLREDALAAGNDWYVGYYDRQIINMVKRELERRHHEHTHAQAH